VRRAEDLLHCPGQHAQSSSLRLNWLRRAREPRSPRVVGLGWLGVGRSRGNLIAGPPTRNRVLRPVKAVLRAGAGVCRMSSVRVCPECASGLSRAR
jgi:hypothetical protein